MSIWSRISSWGRRAPAAPQLALPEPAEVAKAALAFSSAPVPGPTKPAGGDGVSVYGGYLVTGETDPRLIGRNKWVDFDRQMIDVAVIAAAVNVWLILGGSARWTAVANPKGGKDGERAAELVTDGMLEAQLSTPWASVVRRQLMFYLRGFAIQEAIIRRRPDGSVVYADIADRPQWTVRRWDKPDEQSAVLGVEQLTRSGGVYYLPRERLLYSVRDHLTASPEGLGVLRQTSAHARVLDLYLRLEGIGLQGDLRGTPIVRAPIAAMRNQLVGSGKSEAEIRAAINMELADLDGFLRGHNQSPDRGVMLDSSMYRDISGTQAPSGSPQWSVDVLKAAASGLGDVNNAIARINSDIARIMCAEFLLLGGKDAGGAYSMHADKTAMFGLTINAALVDVAGDVQRDLARRLVALNGLDPETCTPKLEVEPVATETVLSACQALQTLASAALDPRDPAINVLRERLRLPPAPEVDETQMLMPRGTEVAELDASGHIASLLGAAAGGAPAGKPAPDAANAGKPGEKQPGVGAPDVKPGAKP